MTEMLISSVQSSAVLSYQLSVEAKTDNYRVNPRTGALVEIDPSQTWFWTPDWLTDEIMVDWELESGEYDDFANMDDFLNSL